MTQNEEIFPGQIRVTNSGERIMVFKINKTSYGDNVLCMSKKAKGYNWFHLFAKEDVLLLKVDHNHLSFIEQLHG